MSSAKKPAPKKKATTPKLKPKPPASASRAAKMQAGKAKMGTPKKGGRSPERTQCADSKRSKAVCTASENDRSRLPPGARKADFDIGASAAVNRACQLQKDGIKDLIRRLARAFEREGGVSEREIRRIAFRNFPYAEDLAEKTGYEFIITDDRKNGAIREMLDDGLLIETWRSTGGQGGVAFYRPNPNLGEQDLPLLSEEAAAVYEILLDTPPYRGLTSRRLVGALQKQRVNIDESTLTSRITLELRPYGIEYVPRKGYRIPASRPPPSRTPRPRRDSRFVASEANDKVSPRPRRKPRIRVSKDGSTVKVGEETFRLPGEHTTEFLRAMLKNRGKRVTTTQFAKVGIRADREWKKLPKLIQDRISKPGRGRVGYIYE